jgi:hypothetical protein
MSIDHRHKTPSAFKLISQNHTNEYKPTYTKDYANAISNKTGSTAFGTCSKYKPLKTSFHKPHQNTLPRITSTENKLLNVQRFNTNYRDNYKKVQPHKFPNSIMKVDYQNKNKQINSQSTSHQTYKLPVLTNNLKNPVTRYDCNKGIVFAAEGSLPTIPSKYSKVSYDTSYKSEFSKPHLQTGDWKWSREVIRSKRYY